MNALDSDNFQIVEQEVLNTGDQWVLKRKNIGLNTHYPITHFSKVLDCKVLDQLRLESQL